MRHYVIVLVLVLSLMPSGFASASEHVETVVSLDPAQGQYPEGIAADMQGNLYVSLAPLGQVWKIAPDGMMTLFASLVDPAILPLALGALGLVVDPTGQVYAALSSFDPATHGVWRISHDGQTQERLAGSEAIQLPNSLVFDRQHNLYVTDSLAGAIWRIPRGGSAEMWLQDELLLGIADLIPGGTPIGANGIAYWHGSLFVTNTTSRQVLRVSIQQDSSAGAPEVVHTFSGTNDFLDGITVDAHGNLYPLVIGQSMLVRLSQFGEVTVLATAEDGLDFPASLVFGTSHGTRHNLFVTNFAVFESDDPKRPGPGVVKVEIGVPYGANCRTFELTGHALCGKFRAFWETHGGLMIFGYPVSNAFEDESGMTVQWLERARFEYRPENAGTAYDVLLGRIGAEYVERLGVGLAP